MSRLSFFPLTHLPDLFRVSGVSGVSGVAGAGGMKGSLPRDG